MRSFASGLALVAACGMAAGPTLAQTPPAQRELEARFDAQISPPEMAGWLKTMSAYPIHVGAPHNKANAEMTLAQFREWGWDARMEIYQVLYPTPITSALELTTGRGAPF